MLFRFDLSCHKRTLAQLRRTHLACFKLGAKFKQCKAALASQRPLWRQFWRRRDGSVGSRRKHPIKKCDPEQHLEWHFLFLLCFRPKRTWRCQTWFLLKTVWSNFRSNSIFNVFCFQQNPFRKTKIKLDKHFFVRSRLARTTQFKSFELKIT